MRKIYLISLLLTNTLISVGQEKMMDFDVKLTTGDSFFSLSNYKSEIIPVVNDKSTAVFFINKDKLYAFEYEEGMNITNEFSDQIPEDFSNYSYLSAVGNGDHYSLLLSNSKNTKYVLLKVDFINKQISQSTDIIKLNKEKFIASIVFNNKSYLVMMGPNNVSFYDVKDDFRKINFDLGKYNPGMGYENIYDLFKYKTIPIIHDNIPSNLSDTYNYNKLYVGERIILTMDEYNNATRLVIFDLETNEHKIKILQQAVLEASFEPNVREESNSFIYKNYIIQGRVVKDEGVLSIKDIDSEQIVEEFLINRDKKITFNNTAIVQEGGGTMYSSERSLELDKTKQLIRKILNSRLALNAFSYKNHEIVVSFGSYKEITQANSGYGMGFGPGGVGVGAPFGSVSNNWVNPVATSYGSSTWSKSVYFKSKLSSTNFGHIKGAIDKTAYDKIDRFKEKNPSKSISLETIYLEKGYYVFGYYDKRDSKYHLSKFTN